MERMTFFIPPVFLFGNNVNRSHNNEENKSEYKTATETEIKVENWKVKRIDELEEKNKNLRERVEKLERLVKELIEYKQDKEVYKMDRN
jgi:uncharacterized membrane protein